MRMQINRPGVSLSEKTQVEKLDGLQILLIDRHQFESTLSRIIYNLQTAKTRFMSAGLAM